MAKVTITGIPMWDGSYELDLSYFTNRELHDIQKIAGIRVGELDEEFRRGNNDLIVAVAAIAITRSGRKPDMDALWDSPSGTIVLADTDDEVVADDPISLPSSDASVTGLGNGTVTSTGGSGENTGDLFPVTTPASIGSPGLEESAA